MSLDLLSQLEAKVQTTLDNLDMLRLEMDELKEENAQLKAEKQAWEDKLGLLLGRFSELESTLDESGLDEGALDQVSAETETDSATEASTTQSWS